MLAHDSASVQSAPPDSRAAAAAQPPAKTETHATLRQTASADAPARVPSRVTLQVNGKTRTLDEGTTVNQLLEKLGLHTAVCAVEVNKAIVRKPDRDAPLAEGDTVEIVTLVGGG